MHYNTYLYLYIYKIIILCYERRNCDRHPLDRIGWCWLLSGIKDSAAWSHSWKLKNLRFEMENNLSNVQRKTRPNIKLSCVASIKQSTYPYAVIHTGESLFFKSQSLEFSFHVVSLRSLINKGTSGQKKIANRGHCLVFSIIKERRPSISMFFRCIHPTRDSRVDSKGVHQLTWQWKNLHFQYRKYTNTNAGCFIVSFRGTESVLQLWWLDFQLPWPAILPPSFTFVAPRRVKLVRSLALKSECNELQTKLEIQLKM